MVEERFILGNNARQQIVHLITQGSMGWLSIYR